eukprot:XP_014038396.1 PREDICTED: uncharacterized protein LOC106591699 [Salmo salar]
MRALKQYILKKDRRRKAQKGQLDLIRIKRQPREREERAQRHAGRYKDPPPHLKCSRPWWPPVRFPKEKKPIPAPTGRLSPPLHLKFSRPCWPPVLNRHPPPKDKKLKPAPSRINKGVRRKDKKEEITKGLPLTRYTDLRRRIAQAGHGPVTKRRFPVAFPCKVCGKPKRKEFAHSQYRGEHFCEAAGGGKTAVEWLEEKRGPEPRVPRTTGGEGRSWRIVVNSSVICSVTKKLAGTAADTAAWVTNVGNEHGQVLVSVLTAGEGDGLLPMAAGLMERYRLAGVAPPQLIYVDRDCCSSFSGSKTAAMFNEWDQLVVRLDIWHLMWRFASGVTTESHQLYGPFMRQLSVCIFEWDAGDVRRLLEAKRSELEGKHGMVGLTEASRKIGRKEMALHCRRRTRRAAAT